jgi:hypothetical protein
MTTMIADEVGHGRIRRAYDGARSVVIYGFGAGAMVGLVTGIPTVLCAGAGAILGLAVGGTYGIVRRS